MYETEIIVICFLRYDVYSALPVKRCHRPNSDIAIKNVKKQSTMNVVYKLILIFVASQKYLRQT
jgi:hypothetical protein